MRKITLCLTILLLTSPAYAFMPFQWTGNAAFEDNALGYFKHNFAPDAGVFEIPQVIASANEFKVTEPLYFDLIKEDFIATGSIVDSLGPNTFNYAIYTGTEIRFDNPVPSGSKFVIGQGSVTKTKQGGEEINGVVSKVNPVTLDVGTYWLAHEAAGGAPFGLIYFNVEHGDSATPVPEPSTLALFTLGTVGAFFRRRA